MKILSIFNKSNNTVVKSEFFDPAHGFYLLKLDQFDEAETYFTNHLKDNALAYYGLGLTRFRKNTQNITLAQLKEIAQLYEESIKIDQSIADVYLMCSIVYNAIAAFTLKKIDVEEKTLAKEVIVEIEKYLEKSLDYQEKSVECNQSFIDIAGNETIKTRDIEKRVEELKGHFENVST